MLSQTPLSLVTVWVVESLLVQVTVTPLATVKVWGEKAKFEIVTADWLEATVADGVEAEGTLEVAGGEEYELHPIIRINERRRIAVIVNKYFVFILISYIFFLLQIQFFKSFQVFLRYSP